MSGDYIHREVLRIQAKYKTSDPYELLDALGAELRESCAYGPKGLKGYCYFSKRTILFKALRKSSFLSAKKNWQTTWACNDRRCSGN